MPTCPAFWAPVRATGAQLRTAGMALQQFVDQFVDRRSFTRFTLCQHDRHRRVAAAYRAGYLSRREQSDAPQPSLHPGSCVPDLLAAHGELCRSSMGAQPRVVIDGAAQAADGVGDEREDRLPLRSTLSTNVRMIIGGRTLQIPVPRSTVS
jgi:hypothetical protein